MQGGYKKFYETEIWKQAFILQKEVFNLTQTFPKDERYGLIDQLNRSTNSVLANFAEAEGRYHYLDRVRVLYIVRGEIQETQSHLIVAASRGYVSRDVSTALVQEYEKIKKQVNGYIYSLIKN